MKRLGYIYDKICDIENIKLAIKKSSYGKRNHNHVFKVMNNVDLYALKIQKMLQEQKYIPSPYKVKKIYDGNSRKERTIYKPNYYPDQIIHWALMLQIQPIIMRGMYKYNCGSIPNRGTGYAQTALRKWIDNDYKGTKYCLKLDISKFYPSVNNDVLKRSFRKIIKDNRCLWLIDTVIDSSAGLPIGNYTSQWFSNYLLQGLDHYIKESLKIKYYVRYVDDLVLLDSNKKKLHDARFLISNYLQYLKLNLKQNWQVFKINDRDIDFLGFRFFRNKTILRKRNSLRISRRMIKIKKKGCLNYKDACAVISYWGWIKRSNSFSFYHNKVKPIVSISDAKKAVSNNLRNNYRRRIAFV